MPSDPTKPLIIEMGHLQHEITGKYVPVLHFHRDGPEPFDMWKYGELTFNTGDEALAQAELMVMALEFLANLAGYSLGVDNAIGIDINLN